MECISVPKKDLSELFNYKLDNSQIFLVISLSYLISKMHIFIGYVLLIYLNRPQTFKRVIIRCHFCGVCQNK